MVPGSEEEVLERLRRLSRERVVVPRIGGAAPSPPAVLGGERTVVEAVRCPACGAPLEQGDLTDDGVCTCPYCGELARVGVVGDGRA